MKNSKCPDCNQNYKLIFKEIRTNFKYINISRKYQCDCNSEQSLKNYKAGTAYSKAEILKMLNAVEMLKIGDEREFCEKIINRAQI